MHMILALFPGTCCLISITCSTEELGRGPGIEGMLQHANDVLSVLKSNEALLVFTYALHTHAHAGSFVGCKK